MGIYVPWLVDAARMAVAGTGKRVIVAPGWNGRGQGALRLLEIVVGHHTGTPGSAPGDYPSLGVVRDGRAGLVGLLSQLGLGRSGDVYVLGNGLAYHAGASAYAGYVDLNDESIGIEAESAGDGRWTAGQLLIYPRLVGSCLHYMRRGPDRYASHRTVALPAGRKPDPAGITDAWMRQQAAAFLANPTPVEDDVSFKEKLKVPAGQFAGTEYEAGTMLAWTNFYVAEMWTQLAVMRAQIAAIASNPDITPAMLNAATTAAADAAAKKFTPTAEQIATAVDRLQRPQIEAAVRDVLGEDNAEQAAAFVNALAAQLAVRPS